MCHLQVICEFGVVSLLLFISRNGVQMSQLGLYIRLVSDYKHIICAFQLIILLINNK